MTTYRLAFLNQQNSVLVERHIEEPSLEAVCRSAVLALTVFALDKSKDMTEPVIEVRSLAGHPLARVTFQSVTYLTDTSCCPLKLIA